MKKIIFIFTFVALLTGMSTAVSAGEYGKGEQYIIENLSSDDFTDVKPQYIGQLKNYFCRDDVDISMEEADDFLLYSKKTLEEKSKAGAQETLSEKEPIYINLQKAAAIIGLQLEYDSSVNAFYGIDSDGYIVIDTQKIIKNTDNIIQSEVVDQGAVPEFVIGIIIFICALVIAVNVRRIYKKTRKESEDYDDEHDYELEVANKKTRKRREQTAFYVGVNEVLQYFYIPIILAAVVVGVGFAAYFANGSIMGSINNGFVNRQPLYSGEKAKYEMPDLSTVITKGTVEISDVTWPKYGEQYGYLINESLDIEAPVYMGDRNELLESGAGTYIGGSIPGMGGTILIGAHDTTYFEALQDVKKNDLFIIVTTYAAFEYQVSDIKICEKDEYDTAYNLDSKKEKLVLYTCYPFGTLNGTKTQRMFVTLDKVGGPDIEYQEEK